MRGNTLWIIVSVYGRRFLLGKFLQGWHMYAMNDRSRQFSGLLRNDAEDRYVGETSKQARFIAIEKRITTRYREAQAFTMPVTCHHCFEPCRHVLSSKLLGTHPPSTYLHIPSFSCRPAMTNEHYYARFRIQSAILVHLQWQYPVPAKDEPYMQAICPTIMRVFAR